MTAFHVEQSDRESVKAWLIEHLTATSAQIELLDQFVALLLSEARVQNLIAKATEPLVWSRHILDSAQLLLHVPRETPFQWVDLGSGAGLPGLVNAILSPKSHFTLVERRPLRADWLNRATDALNLPNVTVICGAVSSVPDRTFDVITARAFAPMPKLLAMAERFATGTTLWILPKGRTAGEEIKSIPGWQGMFHVERSVTDHESGIVIGRIDSPNLRSRGGARGRARNGMRQ